MNVELCLLNGEFFSEAYFINMFLPFFRPINTELERRLNNWSGIIKAPFSLSGGFLIILNQFLLHVIASHCLSINLTEREIILQINKIKLLRRVSWTELLELIPKMWTLGESVLVVFTLHDLFEILYLK